MMAGTKMRYMNILLTTNMNKVLKIPTSLNFHVILLSQIKNETQLTPTNPVHTFPSYFM